jgi:serine/threonine protein kinase
MVKMSPDTLNAGNQFGEQQLIGSRYALLERVGRGQIAEVYRGRDKNTGATVAIKRARRDEAVALLDIDEQIRQEGQVLRELEHPNVVKLLDMVDEDQQVDLILEYVEGGSLKELIAGRSLLPLDRVLEISLDIADALTRVHRLNIVHRDFKPANILIAADGSPKIADIAFTYGFHFDRQRGNSIVFGTPPYLSPETLAGETPSILSNIWSFGVVLYEMLAGRRPFAGDTPGQIQAAIRNRPLPDLAQFRPSIPSTLIMLIDRMLQIDPNKRLPSMRLVSAEIEAILYGGRSTLPSPLAEFAHPPRLLSQPELLTGRFALLDLLSVGGHSEVYYGRDQKTGQRVAIKRLKPALTLQDHAVVSRFLREGELLGQLNHPNIVRVLATMATEGEYYIVMEYVPGGSLRNLLDTRPQLPLSQALTIGLELADALTRTHHMGIIHRDLKPANVLIAEDGTPRLTDFGLAGLMRSDVRLTQVGTVMGSPAYMSPEACKGEAVDSRSDIWSLGIVLYEIVAGFSPFYSDRITAVLIGILNTPTPDITHYRSPLPQALIDLLNQMLAKNPAQRPATVRQVAAKLESICSTI